MKVAANNGINMLFVGATGTGKTQAAKEIAKQLGKNFFSVSVNSSHNFRSTFFGQYIAKNGTTKFIKSKFIEYISTPNSIILLDEINRGVSQSIDSLFTITDPSQKYLDIDEIGERINLAEGTIFIATANIGGEYNTINVGMAAKNRFLTFEFEYLKEDDELKLIYSKYPTLKNNKSVPQLIRFANLIRQAYLNSELDNSISTRYVLDYLCVLLSNDCDITDILEYVVYPSFTTNGNLDDSDRSKVIKFAQSMFDVTDNQLNVNSVKNKKSDWSIFDTI